MGNKQCSKTNGTEESTWRGWYSARMLDVNSWQGLYQRTAVLFSRVFGEKKETHSVWRKAKMIVLHKNWQAEHQTLRTHLPLIMLFRYWNVRRKWHHYTWGIAVSRWLSAVFAYLALFRSFWLDRDSWCACTARWAKLVADGGWISPDLSLSSSINFLLRSTLHALRMRFHSLVFFWRCAPQKASTHQYGLIRKSRNSKTSE